MYTLPYFIQICFHAGGCDSDVVFCRKDYFLENFYWLIELFAFGVVLISEIVFLS